MGKMERRQTERRVKWQGEGAECEICTKKNMATVQNLSDDTPLRSRWQLLRIVLEFSDWTGFVQSLIRTLALGSWAPVSMPVWVNSAVWVGALSETRGYTGWASGAMEGKHPGEASALCVGRT